MGRGGGGGSAAHNPANLKSTHPAVKGWKALGPGHTLRGLRTHINNLGEDQAAAHLRDLRGLRAGGRKKAWMNRA